MSELVRFNVRGIRFKVIRSVIEKSDYFSAIINKPDWDPKIDLEIDDDPKVFRKMMYYILGKKLDNREVILEGKLITSLYFYNFPFKKEYRIINLTRIYPYGHRYVFELDKIQYLRINITNNNMIMSIFDHIMEHLSKKYDQNIFLTFDSPDQILSYFKLVSQSPSLFTYRIRKKYIPLIKNFFNTRSTGYENMIAFSSTEDFYFNFSDS